MTQIGLGSTATANDLWKVEFKYGELAANGVDVDTSKNTGSIAKQIITLPNVAFTQTYKYDALERLTEAKEISTNNQTTWQQSWSYDRFGNRTAFNSSGIGLATINTTPAVNPNTNRFTSTDYQYDKAGNITKDISNGLVREFIFNGDNKQVHVKDASGTPIGTYYYDGNGARVKKTVGGEITIFVYDGDGTLVAEYSTATPSTTPTVSYTTTDHLGSPRVITDKNGNVTSRRDFMPFGEELNAEGTYRTATNKFSPYGVDNIRQRFTGYEKDDETQLDFAEARYYNNKHGRFTAVDPLLSSGKSSNPQTFNRYVYCSNNPIICTDPMGLDGNWYHNEKENRYMYSEDDKTFTDGSQVSGDWVVREIDSTGVFYYPAVRGDGTDLAYLESGGGYGWSSDRNSSSSSSSGGGVGLFPTFGAIFQFRSPNSAQLRSFNQTFNFGSTRNVRLRFNNFGRLEPYTFNATPRIPQNWVRNGPVMYNPNVPFGMRPWGTHLNSNWSQQERADAIIYGGSFSRFKQIMGNNTNYQWHHVVNQNPSNRASFGDLRLNTTGNLIPVRKEDHQKISGFYNSIQPFSRPLRVREWLAPKSFEEQHQFGVRKLRDFGIIPCSNDIP